MSTQPTFPAWKAPVEDSAILLWPDAQQLIAQTRDNQARLSSAQILIQNRPLAELRWAARQWIGHDDARPLVATGHQSELYHAGVWVKNVLIDRLAQKLSGRAVHFSVDTDAPKHLLLRWPGGGVAISDDPRLAVAKWSGLLTAPTPAQVAKMRTEFAAVADQWPFTPVIGPVLDTFERFSTESVDLPSALANALHLCDRELGLKHDSTVASPLWFSPPYLAFVYHILSRAQQFASEYNAALADYRREHRLRSAARPMPDLAISADSCEAPFWLDDLSTGRRRRATVVRRGNEWVLEDGETFVFQAWPDALDAAALLERWLRGRRLRLSPRALTLTLFLRLLVCDQFVHGIGGGRYDQVTDQVMRRHFGIEPPCFSVTTATLYFPLAVGRQRVCVPCVKQEEHRLRHSVLGAAKLDWVRRIESLPQHSQERRALYYEMHGRMAEALLTDPRVKAWETRLAEAQRQFQAEAPLFDRELFYAIQPAERLTGLVDRVGKAV